MKILQINSSVQTETSVSRKLVAQLTEKLLGENDTLVLRNLSEGIPLLTQDMINSFFTPPADRSAEQQQAIAVSDALVAEIQEADTLILGSPIYNFGVPGVLKAYFDLIARVGVTFKYTDEGPKGLLEGKKAYVVIASGGTPLGSAADFASGHIKQFLTFIGISDIQFIDASQLMSGAEAVIAKATDQVTALVAEASLA